MSTEDMLKALRAPLPEHAVKSQKDNPSRKYISVEWYKWRANRVAGAAYRLEVLQTTINVQEKYVLVVVRVHIGDVFRDGIGLYEIGPNGLANAVDRAKTEATRYAFDQFEMGWSNLGVYKDHQIPDELQDLLYCSRCGEAIEGEDRKYCEQNPKLRNLKFHRACTPKHLLPDEPY